MKTVSLTVGPLATNCYLVIDEESRSCMIVDPGGDASEILGAVEREGVRVDKIVLTHAHFDHTGAVKEVRDRTGAPVLVGNGDAELLENPGWMKPYLDGSASGGIRPDGMLSEPGEILLGSISFRVIETPGHTPGSICLYGQGILFSGDTLFLESVGRTDLPGGSFRALKESILGKLFVLPDDTVVYPGHGDTTTIGHEKVCNPFV